MCIDKLIFRFAGFMVLLSLLLGQFVSPYFFWLTAFVGVNLLQSSFTGFCPVAIVLRKAGLKSCAAF